MRIIFYSWQGDTDSKVNKYLIEEALKMAVKQYNDTSGDSSLHYTIDKDTLNVPGSPDIVETILSKIDVSNLVVADVTPIATSEGGKLMANSNVLFEAGYGAGRHGFGRTILVANEAYGKLESQPFDLKTKRITKYALEQGQTEKKKEVIKSLAAAFLATLRMLDSTPNPSFESGEIASEAIKRERDVIKIKRFVERLPIQIVENLIRHGREQLMMDFDTFNVLYNLQAIQGFLGFNLYDPDARDKIDNFMANLDRCLSFGLNFHHHHAQFYSFRASSDVKDSDYIGCLNELEISLDSLLKYLHEKYLEINLEDANKITLKSFQQEMAEEDAMWI